MSNINNLLPTGNSTNWGQQINVVLQNLNQRVGKIESALSNDVGNEIHNLGYAGSGVVGQCSLEFTPGDNKLVFSGGVFVGSTVNNYNPSVNKEATLAPLPPLPPYTYVYLFYDNDDTKSFIENLSIITASEFYYDYTHIMLGVLCQGTPNTFIPKVFSSTKTSMQHNDEYYRRWLVGKSITHEPSFALSANTLTYAPAKPDTYYLYSDGFDQHNIANYEANDKRLITTIDKVLYLRDHVNIESEIETNISTTGLSFCNSNNWTFYRILIGIDGASFLQKHYNTNPSTGFTPTSGNLDKLSDIMLDLEFNNNITGLLASDFVEVARVGLYVDDNDLQTITSSNTNYFYVKSRSNGITPQASVNLQSINSGTLYLDNTIFQNNLNSSNNQQCQLQLQGATSETTTYSVCVEYESEYDNVIQASVTVDNIWSWGGPPSSSVLAEHFNKPKLSINNIIYPCIKIERIKLFWDSLESPEEEWEEMDWDDTPGLTIHKGDSEHFMYFDPAGGVDKVQLTLLWDNSGNIFISREGQEQYIFKLACWELTYLQSYDSYTTNSALYYLDLAKNSNQAQLLTSQFNGGSTNNISVMYNDNRGLELSNTYAKLQYRADKNLLMNNNSTSLSNSATQRLLMDVDGTSLSNSATRRLLMDDGGAFLSNSGGILLSLTDTEAKLQYENSSVSINTDGINFNNNIKLDNGKTFTIGEGGFIVYSSDKRCKDNIQLLDTSYLPIVNQVPIVKYNYKKSNIPQLGIIAQDLEQLLDDKSQCYFIDIIQDDEIENKRVLKETKLVYILWKAIQEQQKEIEELKQKIK